MGDLFANIGTTNWGRDTSASANELEFINALTSPSSDLNLGLDNPEEKQRRVSAPSAPFTEMAPPEKKKEEPEKEKVLWSLKEEDDDEETEIEKERARRKLLKGAIRTSLIQSHSMDDLTQIEDDNTCLHVPGHDFQAQLMSLKVSSE